MNTTTLTIGALSVKVHAAGLGGATIDTAVASEFDVDVEFSYTAGHPGNLSGRWEDAEEPIPDDVEISSIKASANVHFEGDMCDVLIRRGSDMLELFTGREIDQLADRIYKEIQRGE